MIIRESCLGDIYLVLSINVIFLDLISFFSSFLMDIPDLVEDISQVHDVEPVIEPVQSYKLNSSVPNTQPGQRKIPITIITGYLGSGKSTLLKAIGQTTNKKLAIILNEFGDSSVIEKSVTIEDSEKNESIQEWLDLGNGCLCCTVKDNGVVAIEQLIENSKDKIDHILLETTGIADPAPIAKMFWLDEGLTSNIYIDGIVCVVDSANILQCLDDVGGHWHKENNHLKVNQTNTDVLTEEEIELEAQQLQEGITTAHLQIALADVVLINKADKIEGDDTKLQNIKKRILAINAGCPMYTTSFGDVLLDKILDLHAYDASADKIATFESAGGSFHDDRIATVSVDFPFFTSEDDFRQLELFLQYVLWENVIAGEKVEIHRLKGVLVREDAEPDVRVVQAVRETYEIVKGGTLLDTVRTNKLVFIGKSLRKESVIEELGKYVRVN